MKSFALALLVIAASATESYYGGYGGYGPGSSHSSPYRRSSSRYSPRPRFSHEIQRPTPPTYHRPSYESHQPTYSRQQSYAPAYPTSYPSYSKPAATTHVENPWAAVPADPVTTGWYSTTSQYSPPRIPFKSTATANTFAICELNGADAGTGSIQFAQLAGKATKYQATLTGGATSETFTAVIREAGKIGASCADAGEEYNPLTELDKYGNPNPYQDPSRGTIADIVSDGSGDSAVLPTDLLQNLGGSAGILGRSLELTSGAGGVSCCVIALDVTPPQFAAPEFYPATQKGYGQYRGNYYH